jgi:hypothetical protein
MIKVLSYWLFVALAASGQTGDLLIPNETIASGRYLFYLHGAVVTELGNNAINQSVPEWGPYEYLAILDSLRKRNFTVISEIRKKGVADSIYAGKIVKQIDSLLKSEAKEKNIMVVGASSGSDIVLQVSSMLKSEVVKYVKMGGCWPDTYKEYLNLELHGHFLSIIEATDPHGTCYTVFQGRHLKSYQEIKLNTGLSHGFIYKGYKEWIDPMVEWFEKR